MRTDLAPFVGPLLGFAGAALQWIRQYGKVGDRWIYAIALAMAVGAYLLCLDYTKTSDVQSTILFGLLWVSGNVSAVLGGTFAASGVAKTGIAINTPGGIVPLVPMTNSK